jgi:hypothetical protein
MVFYGYDDGQKYPVIDLYFIKGEEFALYQNEGDINTGQAKEGFVLRDGWKRASELFAKYPNIKKFDWDFSDGSAEFRDFVVIPYGGITVGKQLRDVKFEWDIGILIEKMNELYAARGGESEWYNMPPGTEGDNTEFIENYARSFSLTATYDE